MLPSAPYPPAGTGYWGPVTSTINWCEEDYYATIYSAEIIWTRRRVSRGLYQLSGYWGGEHVVPFDFDLSDAAS
ncbi:hypothetical protein EYC84_009033 [Monilinia fructicola]|uniref:Uncharacterized protein n=1 Tax=Monilinia fructicola TaxID=38448 RepID=A0A5M9JB59_MONFR|nr:hypothetical protein EYC84_009033 [Monilinia fructicola]